MNRDENLRLRQELVHVRTQLQDLKEELEDKNNLYVKVLAVLLLIFTLFQERDMF